MSARVDAPPRFVLASGSPRRLDLLRQLGFEPEVVAADVDEAALPGESPDELVERLARSKAEAVLVRLAPDGRARVGDGRALVVLGADTLVVHAGRILGKPREREAFLDNLLALAEDEHDVLSGVAVLRVAPGGELAPPRVAKVVTRVRFGSIDRAAALAYWESGEPHDKAGGYALQGLGARFVASVSGSPSGVIGLPLHETARLLDAAGVRPSYPTVPDG